MIWAIPFYNLLAHSPLPIANVHIMHFLYRVQLFWGQSLGLPHCMGFLWLINGTCECSRLSDGLLSDLLAVISDLSSYNEVVTIPLSLSFSLPASLFLSLFCYHSQLLHSQLLLSASLI